MTARLPVITFALAACTSNNTPSVTPGPGSTLKFTPSAYTFELFSEVCTAGPHAGSSELYSLTLLGDPNEPLRTLINFAFVPGVAQGVALPVALQPFGLISYGIDANGNIVDKTYGQVGALPGQGSFFEWDQGTNVNELDATPLTAVTLTIDAMPSDTGDDGVFTVRMQFQDGGVYDVRVAAPQVTTKSGCPAG